MSFPAVISNRLIKLIGNITKVFSYSFHFLFPKKRFIIPEYSEPIFKTNKNTKIPKIIWQTNFSNRATLPIYLNYLCNRILSPTFAYRYVSTEERLKFIEENTSEEISSAYKRLINGAAQADLWRIILMKKLGGVYLDIDAHVVWPLEFIIEAEDTEVILRNKEHYTNYFIACAPENPIMDEALKIAIDNINNDKVEGGVYYLTGPGVINEALKNRTFKSRFYRSTCVQGSFTNEHFQYLDKPRAKWNSSMTKDDILLPKSTH